MSSLEMYLPPELRGPSTTITKIAAGLSGAGVYRVESDSRAFVLKIAGEDEDIGRWRSKRRIQELAAAAALSPRVVHADESRRAILSTFVVDRSFPAFYRGPRTHDAAVTLLAKTIRRVHTLPIPDDAEAKEPRTLLEALASGPLASFALPTFVSDAMKHILAEDPPARDREDVLSHNDVNPTNLVYDGERLLLLDWDTAGRNDPFYDLASIAVFLRMDDATCRKLLGVYDDAPVDLLPARFTYDRRLVAVLCGAVMLHLARRSGHVGATGGETFESTASLVDFYRKLQTGSVSPATPDGKWMFGLALVRASMEPT